jgi:hypothetical protein
MKILADVQNKAPPKILAGIQNVGIWQKYRRTIESWRALKSPCLAIISAEKFGGPLTIWARRNLQLLTEPKIRR